MLNDYLAKECSLNTLAFKKNAPLASYTTFGIGGEADYLVFPQSEQSLIKLIRFLKKNRLRYLILGNGSNLLFDDKGYRGVVVATGGLRHNAFHDNTVEVACGASLIALSRSAARRALSGLEFACGIPGTVGGAVFMNAGAHGGEMADIVLSSRFLNQNGDLCEITNHHFSYRHSLYQSNGGIILSCKIGLSYGKEEEITARMTQNKCTRESTQPIREKSAGSVFRRADGIIPAALIDQAGLKGLRVGDAVVSEKHAGFIVNCGHATSYDVLALIELIQQKIYSLYRIELIPEVRYIHDT